VIPPQHRPHSASGSSTISPQERQRGGSTPSTTARPIRRNRSAILLVGVADVSIRTHHRAIGAFVKPHRGCAEIVRVRALSLTNIMTDAGKTLLLNGKWQCSAVRYMLSALPERVRLCHSRECQKAVGEPFAARQGAPIGLCPDAGSPGGFASSSIKHRDLCPECGTPLSFRYDDSEPVSVIIDGLDRGPQGVRPARHWVIGDLIGRLSAYCLPVPRLRICPQITADDRSIISTRTTTVRPIGCRHDDKLRAD
jgi:hypothetical protein